MKVLLTGGCSFSECISPWIDTWPKHLANNLPGYKHISVGLGSQGNGLISRKIIFQLTQLLKKHNPEDILVGIMWSGPNRSEVYDQQPSKVLDDGQENPTQVVNGSDGSWTILNHNWKDNLSITYYKHFQNKIGNEILTLEHILRVQWFLKLNQIEYFMSTYTGEVFSAVGRNHPDTKHLYDQIDFGRFLNVVGEYEWCRDHSSFEFPTAGDNHPGTDQHREFTEQVILPFLKIV